MPSSKLACIHRDTGRMNIMHNSQRFPNLLKCDLLSDLPVDVRKEFLNRCTVRNYQTAKEVISQGHPFAGMFLVAEGIVEISYLTADGERAIIHHARKGETVGEAEALAEVSCAATCVAQSNTTVLHTTTEHLYQMMQHRLFIRNVARSFAATMSRDSMFKSVDTLQPVEQRICSYLRQLSLNGPTIHESQTYLAQVVGCSRQTINKVLGELRKAGIVEVRQKQIVIRNPSALDTRAHHSANSPAK
ncbi:Crp/Fnr family transcriptional regulator [Qingshengfaniella alkalisoli]|uniref:Crp/Fnr family transcriptional regulator n=1 Tax=Qingshengfaniella alkalisoli TaxID=2599296 RepID=A0A5B8J3P3_9RHOB|nr:Crp/Fnr family transcriptional regulator [Qingshengfaniella alkalisoli]QDY71328.1 Crp/Fnr family transcriptional regulator [Qingshengfaniella alkalisoli]